MATCSDILPRSICTPDCVGLDGKIIKSCHECKYSESNPGYVSKKPQTKLFDKKGRRIQDNHGFEIDYGDKPKSNYGCEDWIAIEEKRWFTYANNPYVGGNNE